MPHSSRFTWLKTRLGQHSTKLLRTTPSNLRQNTLPRSPIQEAITEEAHIIISENMFTASVMIRSMASLVVLEVIEAQVGTLTTAAVARFTANHIIRLLKTFILRIELAYRGNLERVARAASALAYVTEIRAEVNALAVIFHVKNSLKGHHREDTVTAIANAEKYVVRTVADAIADHVAIPGSTESSVRELVSALSTAASRMAFTGADIVPFVDDDPPPPYTENLT
ncbi:hypothetical protein F5B20DRAFT_595856 [Whalleya microplaca]|nr:hypothetical protein F5B20DRAFT_595856 [Whalleya microplaca]